MNVFGLSIPLVAALVVVVATALLLSVITLFNYLFGGPNPLSRNVDARVEAAQNPANLQVAWRDYRRRRFVGVLVVLTALYAGLLFLAPEAAVSLAESLWAVVVAIGSAIQQSAAILAEQIGSP